MDKPESVDTSKKEFVSDKQASDSPDVVANAENLDVGGESAKPDTSVGLQTDTSKANDCDLRGSDIEHSDNDQPCVSNNGISDVIQSHTSKENVSESAPVKAKPILKSAIPKQV